MSKFITIARYTEVPLAELGKGKLESEGIESYLLNKHHISINWLYSNALGGVKIQVLKEDAEMALEILNQDYSSELVAIEEMMPPLTSEDLCPKCGSSNIEIEHTSRKDGAISFLLIFIFHLPVVFYRKRNKCNDCNYIFKPRKQNIN